MLALLLQLFSLVSTIKWPVKESKSGLDAYIEMNEQSTGLILKS
jgi:hypothetical protein